MKSRDHVNIDSANFLYIVFNNVDGCVIKKNDDKHFASTEKNKEVLKNYTKLWIEIKNLI